jgi:hypothetical protein
VLLETLKTILSIASPTVILKDVEKNSYIAASKGIEQKTCYSGDMDWMNISNPKF